MFCTNCGNQVKEGSLFCTSCGAKVSSAFVPEEQRPDETVEAPVETVADEDPIIEGPFVAVTEVKEEEPILEETVVEEPVAEEPAVTAPVITAPVFEAPVTVAPVTERYDHKQTAYSKAAAKKTVTAEDLPPKFRPLGAWAYFGWSLLFSIPFAGLVLLIVFSFVDKNRNLRNFARSHFCAALIVVVLLLIAVIVAMIIMLLTGETPDLNVPSSFGRVF